MWRMPSLLVKSSLASCQHCHLLGICLGIYQRQHFAEQGEKSEQQFSCGLNSPAFFGRLYSAATVCSAVEHAVCGEYSNWYSPRIITTHYSASSGYARLPSHEHICATMISQTASVMFAPVACPRR
eukprot:scpid37073/ scgid33876/ 